MAEQNPAKASTLEQVMFERMGVSVEDALATGIDAVDESMAQSVEQGIDVDARMGQLLSVLVKLTEPENLKSLTLLIDRLPQLASLAKMADQLPGLLATLGDVADEFQQQCETDGIDLECSLRNGLHAALWFGCQVDRRHLSQLGDLLNSDLLSNENVSTLQDFSTAVKSARESSAETPRKIGLTGLLGLLRNPSIQRSLGFLANVGEKFGDSNNPN